MFLNNLSIYSVPFVGIVFLIIGLSFSKTMSLFTYQLSRKEKQRQSVISHTNDLQNLHVTVQINPFSQLDNLDSYRQRPITVPLDDDEELIKSDISSISNFCDNNSIELRLDQDIDYDNDTTN